VRYKDAPMAETSMLMIVQDVLAMLGPAIKDKGAVIRYGELPDVTGNIPQLVLLIQNLVGNALKFSNAATPQVTIEAERQDREVVFSVADNGIGISPNKLERIFEPFYRLHSTAKYAGAGLGLAICQKVVERHGGRIWCESTGTDGAVFYFTLPAARDEHASS
jgi:signal transduction histidine kinase